MNPRLPASQEGLEMRNSEAAGEPKKALDSTKEFVVVLKGCAANEKKRLQSAERSARVRIR